MLTTLCDPDAVAAMMACYRATLERYAHDPLPPVEKMAKRITLLVTGVATALVVVLMVIVPLVMEPQPGRKPNYVALAAIAVGFPLGMAAITYLVASIFDRYRTKHREAYDAAAQELGFTFVGERLVEGCSADAGALPLLHAEEQAPAARVVMGGNLHGREVLVVECSHLINPAIAAPAVAKILVASQGVNTQARVISAIIVPNVQAADVLLLSEKDIESKYCRKLLPKDLIFDDLAPKGFLLAALQRGVARLLAPVLTEHAHGAPQLCVQLLAGQLVLWNGSWNFAGGPTPRLHSGKTVENVHLALALATALEKAGERTSGEVQLL